MSKLVYIDMTAEQFLDVIQQAYQKTGFTPKDGLARLESKRCCPLLAIAMTYVDIIRTCTSFIHELKIHLHLPPQWVFGFACGFDHDTDSLFGNEDFPEFIEGLEVGRLARERFLSTKLESAHS